MPPKFAPYSAVVTNVFKRQLRGSMLRSLLPGSQFNVYFYKLYT